jgi:hypothetical protein
MSNGFTGTTNVPPPSFTTTGFVAPQGSAVLTGVQTDINAAFGASLNFNLNTPQGQLSSSLAAIIANTDQSFAYFTMQVDPAYASGIFQDGVARIYFLERDPAEPTTLQVLCTGLTGVIIPVGSLISDPAGNIYASLGTGVILASGSVTITFAAQQSGPIGVPSSVTIYQAVPGWDTVSIVSGIEGTNVESRAAFEQRREDSVAGNSLGPVGAIIGAVSAVPGVIDFYGYNNNTAGSVVVGGVSIAAYSIYICVAGGNPQAVGQAILSKKGPGAPMTGNTTVTVYDSNPLYASPIPYTITYDIPASLPVYFAVTLQNNPGLPSNFVPLVQNAIVAAFAGGSPGVPRARIGSTIYAQPYVPAISALGSWALTASIEIGSTNTSDASVTASISGTVLTVTGILSGTIINGDYVTGSTGGSGIVAGTYITSFGTGAGGTGTYNLNNTNTLSSTTVTCASADQSFVAVQINQEPQTSAVNITVVHT